MSSNTRLTSRLFFADYFVDGHLCAGATEATLRPAAAASTPSAAASGDDDDDDGGDDGGDDGYDGRRTAGDFNARENAADRARRLGLF